MAPAAAVAAAAAAAAVAVAVKAVGLGLPALPADNQVKAQARQGALNHRGSHAKHGMWSRKMPDADFGQAWEQTIHASESCHAGDHRQPSGLLPVRQESQQPCHM